MIYPTKKFEDLVDFQNGLWTAKKKPSRIAKVVRNTNFRNGGRFDFSDVAEIEVEERQLASRLLEPGDLLLERSGGGPTQPVGRVMFFDGEGEFSFSNFTTRIRTKSADKLDPIYLWRYLNYLYDSGFTERLQKQTTGIRNLIFSEYKEIQIPLPPVEDQSKIAERIEKQFKKIDEAARLRAANEKCTAALLPAALQEIFSASAWKEKELGEVVNIQNGFAFKSGEYVDSGLFVMRIGNVQNGYISLDDPKYIDSSRKEEFEKFLLNEGDILMSLTGNVGRVGVAGREHLPALLNQRVARITVLNEKMLHAQYAFYFLRSDLFARQCAASGQGMAQLNVSTKKIAEIKIPLPPLAEQKAIVKKLDSLTEKVRKLQELQRQQSADLKELKLSIMQKAFALE